MEEDILLLEEKINNLSNDLILSSYITKEEIYIIKKEYYKSLISSLNIIKKQKEEIIDLKLLIIEKDHEINKKDIMRFCLS
jgi:hypothetical protein